VGVTVGEGVLVAVGIGTCPGTFRRSRGRKTCTALVFGGRVEVGVGVRVAGGVTVRVGVEVGVSVSAAVVEVGVTVGVEVTVGVGVLVTVAVLVDVGDGELVGVVRPASGVKPYVSPGTTWLPSVPPWTTIRCRVLSQAVA
jgi:hypothetical protein